MKFFLYTNFFIIKLFLFNSEVNANNRIGAGDGILVRYNDDLVVSSDYDDSNGSSKIDNGINVRKIHTPNSVNLNEEVENLNSQEGVKYAQINYWLLVTPADEASVDVDFKSNVSSDKNIESPQTSPSSNHYLLSQRRSSAPHNEYSVGQRRSSTPEVERIVRSRRGGVANIENLIKPEKKDFSPLPNLKESPRRSSVPDFVEKVWGVIGKTPPSSPPVERSTSNSAPLKPNLKPLLTKNPIVFARSEDYDHQYIPLKSQEKFIVANIDSGVDYNLPELSEYLWRKEINGVEVTGYDFVDEHYMPYLPYDKSGHGTFTTGIIAAQSEPIGDAANNISIMNLKILNHRGLGSTSNAIRAIHFAIKHRARIINASWSIQTEHYNPALFEAIQEAQKNGILFVAAAGNDGREMMHSTDTTSLSQYKLDNIISVAAIDQEKNQLAEFSNYGYQIHLAAPGVMIQGPHLDNKSKILSGTSMAAPYVTAALAFLWSLHPEWTHLEVKNWLLANVDQLDNLANKVSTQGKLNSKKAAINAFKLN